MLTLVFATSYHKNDLVLMHNYILFVDDSRQIGLWKIFEKFHILFYEKRTGFLYLTTGHVWKHVYFILLLIKK